MRDTSSHPDRVYMAEAEQLLERNRSSIRVWEDRGWLPSELMPHRDENGWRYWTRAQIDGIKRWMSERNQGRSVPGRREAGQPVQT